MRHVLIAISLPILLIAAAVSPGWAGARVALVIGNSGYQNVPALANPKNDAEALAGVLRTAGFDQVTELEDLDQTALRRALQDFSAKARGADIALVYFAGHGVEVAGRNYLVPTDATLVEGTDVDFEAIPLDNVRTAVSGATKLRLVILDACRNNPFKLASGDGKRSVSRGLARVEPNANELIAYAAREGTVAGDGSGGNSPYARALAKYLGTPGLEIRLMFGQIRDEVVKATAGEQEPFTYGTLGGEPIFLNAAPAVASAEAPKDAGAAAKTGAAGSLLDEAAVAWVAVKDTTSVAVLKTYIARYQGTVFSEMAIARLDELQAGAKPAPAKEQPAPAQPEKPAPVMEKATPPQQEILADNAPAEAVEPPPAVARSLTINPKIAPVGKWAEGAAFDGHALWVAESGQRTIAEVDPNTGAVVRRVTVGRLPVGIEARSDGTIYSLVMTDKTVWVQPPGGKGKRLAAFKDCPQDIAVNDKAVWVLTQQDCSSVDGRAVLVNPQTGRQSQTGLLGEWPQAIALGHGKVWVAHVRGGLVNMIDPGDLLMNTAIIDGGSFWDIATNQTGVFVGGRVGDDNAQGLVVALDPETGNEVGRQSFDQMINTIVADEKSVVAVGIEGKIWVLSPQTLAIERVITLSTGPYRPSDALLLGGELVVVCQQCNGENGAVLAVGSVR